MSEMSMEQGPVGGDVAFNPTDDTVPPGARARQDPDSPQDRSEYDGSEDVGPQDYGAEDVTSTATVRRMSRRTPLECRRR